MKTIQKLQAIVWALVLVLNVVLTLQRHMPMMHQAMVASSG